MDALFRCNCTPVEALRSAETVPENRESDMMIRLRDLAVFALAAGVVQGSPHPLLGDVLGGGGAGGADKLGGGGAFPFVVSPPLTVNGYVNTPHVFSTIHFLDRLQRHLPQPSQPTHFASPRTRSSLGQKPSNARERGRLILHPSWE